MGLVPSPICQKCDTGEQETAFHHIGECPVYNRLRTKVWGHQVIQADTIRMDDTVNSTIKFTTESVRLTEWAE